TRYFALPVVPTVLGFDPRIQLIHEDDGLEVLRLATLTDRPGIVNVGGSGVLLLSQAIRRAGRVPVPILSPLVQSVGQLLRRAGMVDFSPEQMRFLQHGRVADTTKLRERFAYTPGYTTLEAFDDYIASRALNTLLTPERIAGVEEVVLDTLERRRTVHA
ncbi:MAG TPA: NAD-dependent dehydratase, partial [Mycobacteriales bacterium]|nr:NAD-dependent dehydratase [Mycobacteriales bacterium]